MEFDLKKRELRKSEITAIKNLGDNPLFILEFMAVVDKFNTKEPVKNYIAELVLNELPIYKAISPTWLVYEVCNAFNDCEIKGYLSELVGEIEDLTDSLTILVEKYLKK